MQNNTAKLALLFGIIATMGFGTLNNASAASSGALGHIELVLKNQDGYITQYIQTDNLITTEGLDCIVGSVFTGAAFTTCSNADPFDVIAIGNGTGGNASAQQLVGALDSGCIAGVEGTVVLETETTPQSAIIQVIFGGAGSGAEVASTRCEFIITEAGLFNTGDATTPTDNLLAYQFFSAITIGDTDTLTVTWDLEFS